MVKSYCVKQKKQTECVEPSGYKQAKNGRLMFFCTCAECGITKTKFVKSQSTGGGNVSKSKVPNTKIYCGIGKVPKGKKRGRYEDCFDKGQIRYYGLNEIDNDTMESLIETKKIERARNRRDRRKKAKKDNLN